MLSIVLVEDSKLLSDRLQESIAQISGAQIVCSTATEREAVAYLQSTPVDLLILDLQLREGTGFGVMAALRNPKPQIIVFTNYALPMYAQRSRQMGAHHVLDKALDFERLLTLVEDLCTKSQ